MTPLKMFNREKRTVIYVGVGAAHTNIYTDPSRSWVFFFSGFIKFVPFLLQKRFLSATKWAFGPSVLPSSSHHCLYNVGEF
jgi:hypothetical protein